MEKWFTDKEKQLDLIFIIFVFCALMGWMIIQPLGAGPDEKMRYSIVQYIFVHWQLPHGGDPEIIDKSWGFSYAFQPILPYMIAAVFAKVGSIFSMNGDIILLFARFVNIIIGTVMAILTRKLAKRIFDSTLSAWLFTLLIVLLPQAMFMHTYVNTDSMALMSTILIVYAWVEGIKTQWNVKACLLLSLGIIFCAMSYYNAYGYILCSIILLVLFYIKMHNKSINVEWSELIKKGCFIATIVLIGIAWWFIRSYIIYDGDILGLRIRDEYAEIYAIDSLKPSLHETFLNQGYSILHMLKNSNFVILTGKSFVAMFGNMAVGVYDWIYTGYLGIIVIGLVGMLIPQKERTYLRNISNYNVKIININMFLCMLIPNILNIWAAYSYDYQPQGRYSLPMLVALMYFVSIGIHKLLNMLIKKEKARQIVKLGLCLWIIFVCLVCLRMFIIPMNL
ncbi:MAG: ArnT family glycosyltransferase [Lachnotalea sp.]